MKKEDGCRVFSTPRSHHLRFNLYDNHADSVCIITYTELPSDALYVARLVEHIRVWYASCVWQDRCAGPMPPHSDENLAGDPFFTSLWMCVVINEGDHLLRPLLLAWRGFLRLSGVKRSYCEHDWVWGTPASGQIGSSRIWSTRLVSR